MKYFILPVALLVLILATESNSAPWYDLPPIPKLPPYKTQAINIEENKQQVIQGKNIALQVGTNFGDEQKDVWLAFKNPESTNQVVQINSNIQGQVLSENDVKITIGSNIGSSQSG